MRSHRPHWLKGRSTFDGRGAVRLLDASTTRRDGVCPSEVLGSGGGRVPLTGVRGQGEGAFTGAVFNRLRSSHCSRYLG